MNIEVTRINNEIKKNPEKYVLSANEEYTYILQKIVDDVILHQSERPVIVLAGPSGSGKTTTALTIGKLLTKSGHKTHTISMDNYFRSLTENEKHLSSIGKMDLESPLRIDNELLSSHIQKISNGETVEIPKYNFGTSSRETESVPFQRQHGELVIFDGCRIMSLQVIRVLTLT